MQKVRKSSLSPCYVNSNKENVQIDNFVTPNGLSFRNLEKERKKVKDVTVDLFSDAQKFKGRTSQRKPPANLDHSTDECRGNLKSKEKQISSLHSQVKTLTATITLLKEQLKNTKHENEVLSKLSNEAKSKLQERSQVIEKMKKEKVKYEEDLKEYRGVLPQLNEIEEQQNQLIHEN